MIKHARIDIGRTPDEMSGEPCVAIVDGEPQAVEGRQHPDPGLKEAAAQLRPLLDEDDL